MVSEDPRVAARRFAQEMISKGFRPEALHEYTRGGEQIFFVIRLKHPDTREKWIRPMSQNGDGRFHLCEPEFTDGRPLYNEDLIRDHAGARIWLVEGEWAADHLNRHFEQCAASDQHVAVTFGSAQNISRTNWDPVVNRNLAIWRDNDKPGLECQNQLITILSRRGCNLSIVDVSALNLPEKGDCVDWLSRFAPAGIPSVDELPLLPSSPAWPLPKKIGHTLRPVPTFDPRLIPQAFRAWAEDTSERMECPIEFIAASLMVGLGAVVGTTCAVRPKSLDDWTVYPNTWGALVGRPAARKSPALKSVMSLFRPLDEETHKDFQDQERRYNADLSAYQVKRRGISSKRGHHGRDDEERDEFDSRDLASEFYSLIEPSKPVHRRFYTNDVTVEKLSEICSQNPRGILIVRDELTGLFAGWDKPERSGDRAFFLEGWNGDSSYITDRIQRGTIRVDKLCLSLLGTIQPSKLVRYLNEANDGYKNDGFIQRVQFLVYPNVPNYQGIDRRPDAEAREKAEGVVHALSTMNFEPLAAKTDYENSTPYFRFDDAVQPIVNEWFRQLEEKIRDPHLTSALQEHFGKYRKLMPAIALLVHLCDSVERETSGPIGNDALYTAIDWCALLEEHARRVYQVANDPIYETALIIAEKLIEGKIEDRCFSARDVYRKQWKGMVGSGVVKAACRLLVEHDWLRVESTPGGFQQKPRTVYVINPRICELDPDEF